MDEPRELSELYSRYALGLASREKLAVEENPERAAAVREQLWEELGRLGAHGWPERRTIYTRGLPPGCLPCLAGRGSNLALTTLCNRDCFFCFNPRPREDVLSVHGRGVADEAQALELLESLGIQSVGLSGGEPLLNPERVLGWARRLRRRFGSDLRLDLYTNGDLLTPELARALRGAGIDGLRLNLAAGGCSPAPAAIALEVFENVAVEIPAVPALHDRISRLMLELEALKAPFLILHELFSSAQNQEPLGRRGHRLKAEPAGSKLTWSAVAGSEETALRLMRAALEMNLGLSVYYCSCATQQWIAERALRR